jgi:hypothetical protein
MRNRDGLQPAKPVDQSDRGVIYQRDAIPQDIPLRCAKEQSALADRELGLRVKLKLHLKPLKLLHFRCF